MRSGLSTALYWLISPALLGATCILLGFALIVAAGQRARYQREAVHLKEEWMRYRKEMQAKVWPSCWVWGEVSGSTCIAENVARVYHGCRRRKHARV